MNTKAIQKPISPALTSAQLDALLMQPDPAPADLAQHPEFASLHSLFHDLRTSSLAAADCHRHQARHASAPSSRFMSAFAGAWGVLAAATLVCAIAIPLALHHRQPATAGPLAVAASSASVHSTTTATPAAQPISPVSDEALFADVQADLNDSVPSAMAPLADSIQATSTTQRTR